MKHFTHILILMTAFSIGTQCFSSEHYMGWRTRLVVSKLTISSEDTIEIGEPLIVKLIADMKNLPDPNKIPASWSQEGLFKIFADKEKSNFPKTIKAIPRSLPLLDTDNLKYGGSFPLFYYLGHKELIFNEPGIYEIQFSYTRTQSSNVLRLIVHEPGQQHKKAISLLSDPNDYFFLELGNTHENYDKEKAISHLQEIVEKCEGTILADWSAARLGIEYFKEFQKKHPSIKKFKAKKQKDEVDSSLFDKAHIYLQKGSALPDEFPIHGEVLDNLMKTEYINNNYQKAIRLAEELESKYPHSKYGKRASRAKKELRELEESEKGKK